MRHIFKGKQTVNWNRNTLTHTYITSWWMNVNQTGGYLKGTKEKKNRASNDFCHRIGGRTKKQRFVSRQELIENTFLQRFQGGQITGYKTNIIYTHTHVVVVHTTCFQFHWHFKFSTQYPTLRQFTIQTRRKNKFIRHDKRFNIPIGFYVIHLFKWINEKRTKQLV